MRESFSPVAENQSKIQRFRPSDDVECCIPGSVAESYPSLVMLRGLSISLLFCQRSSYPRFPGSWRCRVPFVNHYLSSTRMKLSNISGVVAYRRSGLFPRARWMVNLPLLSPRILASYNTNCIAPMMWRAHTSTSFTSLFWTFPSLSSGTVPEEKRSQVMPSSLFERTRKWRCL